MITVTYLSPRRVCRHVFVHADDVDLVEPGGVVDQHAATFVQHRGVRGVPRHRKSVSDSGHAQVLTHDAFQGPPHSAAGQLGPRFGRLAGVLPPYPRAPCAVVAANGDQQQCRPPAQRFVREQPGHRVPRGTPPSTPTTFITGRDDPASDDRPARFQELPDSLQPELLEPAERGQIRVGEGSVSHVEVLRMSGVRTFILRGPRPLPGQRRAHHPYTLKCDEPEKPAAAERHSGCRYGDCPSLAYPTCPDLSPSVKGAPVHECSSGDPRLPRDSVAGRCRVGRQSGRPLKVADLVQPTKPPGDRASRGVLVSHVKLIGPGPL